MKLLVFFLLIAVVTLCAADLLPNLLPEKCNGFQNALCSVKCLSDNHLCLKSDASLGYTCTCL